MNIRILRFTSYAPVRRVLKRPQKHPGLQDPSVDVAFWAPYESVLRTQEDAEVLPMRLPRPTEGTAGPLVAVMGKLASYPPLF